MIAFNDDAAAEIDQPMMQVRLQSVVGPEQGNLRSIQAIACCCSTDAREGPR